jgi:DNA-binding NarL/FixJ family response regulator
MIIMINVVFNFAAALVTFDDGQSLLPLGKDYLTSRRAEVVGEVLKGLDNPLIGKNLGIAWRTVGNHLTEICQMTGLCSKEALIVGVFQKHGSLIEAPDIDRSALVAIVKSLPERQKRAAFIYRTRPTYQAVSEELRLNQTTVSNILLEVHKKLGAFIPEGASNKAKKSMLIVLLNLVPEECFETHQEDQVDPELAMV